MVEASSGDRIASLLHRARGSVHTRRMARVPKKHEVVKGLLDNLNEALVILDPALEVVEWNAAMERLTGIRSADAVEGRSEEHTSELQSRSDIVCRLLLEKKKQYYR